MSQVLTKATTVLMAVMVFLNAQCLAVCSLEPCLAAAPPAQSQQASASHCHQTQDDQQEEQEGHEPSCSHEAALSESVAKVSLPESVPVANVAPLPAVVTPATKLLRVVVADSSPPLTRVIVSSTVLRI